MDADYAAVRQKEVNDALALVKRALDNWMNADAIPGLQSALSEVRDLFWIEARGGSVPPDQMDQARRIAGMVFTAADMEFTDGADALPKAH